MRKKIILIFSLSLLILLALITGITHNWSPEQALNRYNSKNSLTLHTLKKIDLDKNKAIFVTKGNIDQLNLFIIEKNYINSWEVSSVNNYENFNNYLVNTFLTDKNFNKYNLTSGWSIFKNEEDPDKKGILYGFFTGTNNNYKEIYVDDIKCNIEKIDDNLFLYYCFSGPPKFNYKVVE